MQLQLSIHSPGLHLDTVLDADALPKLLELVQQHSVEHPDQDLTIRRRGRRWRRFSEETAPVEELNEASVAIMERVTTFDKVATFFTRLDPKTYPEKFLVLAAWHATKAARDSSDPEVKGRQLVGALVELGQTPPGNPARDVHHALDQGWLARSPGNRRRLRITNAGWKRIGELFDGGDATLASVC